jgi:RNA polymerase sigma-70 factor (ECF subfamily)
MDLLAARIKIGDRQAFELFFRKHYIPLCGFINKFLNDPERSKEIVQDVFIRIWENRRDIDPEMPLKAFLFKIAQNASLNVLQRNKTESTYAAIYKLVYIEHSEFTVHESLLARELEDSIATAIGKLPCECRRVFELSRVEGLKYSEIANTLNISIKTVEAQMSKALRSLRLELSEYLTLILITLIALHF